MWQVSKQWAELPGWVILELGSPQLEKIPLLPSEGALLPLVPKCIALGPCPDS